MRHFGRSMITLLLTTLVLGGCGSTTATEEQDKEEVETEGSSENAETEGSGRELAVSDDGTGELISDEDAEALQYVKKYMLEDDREEGASYPVYAPDGSSGGEGYIGGPWNRVFCVCLQQRRRRKPVGAAVYDFGRECEG